MILLLGSGYIGSAFARELTARKLEFIPMSRSGFDYTNYEKLVRFFRDHKFDLVINAAGYSGVPNVDACEEKRLETFAGNVHLPVTVAHACGATVAGIHGTGIPFLQVSSGCIYNGYTKEFTEEDEPNFSFLSPPCSFYSGTKALAEKLLAPFQYAYICRLRLPFDELDSPRNYLSKLLRYPKLINARNSLSHRGDFVKACMDLYQRKSPYGIYNLTNPGHASAAEITCAMNHVLKLERRFNFFADLDEFNQTVKAPRSNCVLDGSKALAAGVKIRPVWDALSDSLEHWRMA